MSDLGTGVGHITIDSSGAVTGANAARDALGGMVASATQNFYGLQQVGQMLNQIGDSLTNVATSAISTASTMETAGQRLTTQIYDTSASQKDNVAAGKAMAGQMQDLAISLEQPTKAVESLAAVVAGLGFRGDDVKKVTTNLTQLASDTGTNAEAIAAPMGRLIDQFHLTADQSANLGSAIYALSTHVNGGAQAMILMQQRSSELASAIGLSVPQTLAINAAMTDLDGRTRGAAQTMSQFAITIPGIIEKGGAPMKALATLAGETGAAFKQQFQTDAFGAIQAVLTGLNNLNSSGQNIIPVLADMGIKGQQPVSALLALASASTNATGQGKSLTDYLRIATQGFGDAGLAGQVYGTRQDTAAAASIKLHDEIGKLQNKMGQELLPVYKIFLTVADDVVKTLTSTPGALLGIAGGVALVLGPVASLVGWFVQLGNQVLFAIRNLSRMAESMAPVAEEAPAVATGIEEVGAAAATAGPEVAQLALDFEAAGAAILQLELPMAGLGNTLTTVGGEAAVAGAEVGASGLAGGLGALAGFLGPVAIGLAALTYGMQQTKTEANSAKQATSDFMKEIQQKEGTTSVDGLNKQLDDLNAKIKTVQQTAKGGGDSFLGIDFTMPKSFGDFAAEVVGAKTPTQKTATNEAKDLQDQVNGIKTQLSNAAAIAHDFGISVQAAMDMAAKAGINLSGNLTDIHNKLNALQTANTTSGKSLGLDGGPTDAQVTAIVALADDQFKVATSADSAANSEANYAAQLRNVADQSLKVSEAQLKIKEAQLGVEQATIAVIQAQETNRFAAQDQARALYDAQNAVVNAQRQIADNTNAVARAQYNLQELNGPDYWISYQQAINSVADTQLRLNDDTQKAADAQWYLNYLLQEGASARDIQDARSALADANQKVTDTTTNLQSAEQKVSDLPTQHALALGDAQKALDNANRQVQTSTDALAVSEENLAKQQDITANNLTVRTAKDALTAANFHLQGATYAVRDAELALQKLEDGSVERALTTAKDAVSQSLYAEAAAIAKQKEDQDAANGITDSATQKAQYLAQALIDIGTKAGALGQPLVAAGQSILNNLRNPADEATQALQRMADVLGHTLPAAQAMAQLYQSGKLQGPVSPAEQGALTGLAHSALGNYFTRPAITWVAENSPEVVLPTNDIDRSMALLQQSGLMSSISSYINNGASTTLPYSAITNNNSTGGHQFNLTAITSADPSEIVDQFFWEARVTSRS